MVGGSAPFIYSIASVIESRDSDDNRGTSKKMKIRPAEFWEKFDNNAIMLNQAFQTLKTGDQVEQVEEALSRSLREGDLMAIEFLSQLVKFCQRTVGWFGVERLAGVEPTKIVRLKNIIRAVKTAMGRFKQTIVQQNYVEMDPLECYRIHLELVEGCYSKLMANVAAHLRSLAAAARSPSPTDPPPTNSNGKRRQSDVSSDEEDEADVQKLLTGIGFGSDSEDSGSESTEVIDAADEEDQKPDSERLGTSIDPPSPHPSESAAQTDLPQESLAWEEDVKPNLAEISTTPPPVRPSPPRSQRAISTGVSEDIKPEIKPTHDERPEGSASDQVKLEDSNDQLPHESIDQRKQTILNSLQLQSSILSDLWVSHQIIKTIAPFKFPKTRREFKFALDRIGSFTFPSSQTHQIVTETDEEEKLLPLVLTLFLDIELEHSQDLAQIAQLFRFLVNGEKVVIENFRQMGARIRLVLPVQPSSLKEGMNRVMIEKWGDEDAGRVRWEGRMTIEEVVMMSEKEVFEKAIGRTSTNNRSVKLAQGCPERPLTDPTDGVLVDCPVRGAGCRHFQCFDLLKFIDRQRFEASWTCPIETCKQSCKPLELEFDDWVFRNIQACKNPS